MMAAPKRGLPRAALHDRAPLGEGPDVPAGHLGVVVGAAQREDVVEPRLGIEAGSLGVVEPAALDLERVDAPRAQARRVIPVDGHEVTLCLVVVADEPRDPFAEQVGHRGRAGAGVRAGTARPQHGAHVVHEPGDLELVVVRRGVGEERRALQPVREQIDVLGVGGAGAGLEHAEERVDVRDRRARHVAGR